MCDEPAQTTLADFLSTGSLGSLDVGLTLDETLSLLGPPDGAESIEDFFKWLDGTDYDPLGLEYGNLELWFDQGNVRNQLCALGPVFSAKTAKVEVDDSQEYVLNYFSVRFLGIEPEPLPGILGVDWLELGYRMNTRSFKEYVDEHNIVCVEILFPFNQPKEFMTLVVPVSNVMISFDLESGKDQLTGIGKGNYVETRFPMQQW